MLNPAKDAPERRATVVRVSLSSLRITSVESSPSTLTTPMRALLNSSRSNHTATMDARLLRVLSIPFRFDGPSSMPTALGGCRSFLKRPGHLTK
jgi:hypothetical protein